MTENEKQHEPHADEPMNFTSLVFMLAAGAMQNMGVIANPVTQKVEKNLKMARQTIDLLDILRAKTQGNLDQAESRLLAELLADLKLKIVRLEQEKP